MDARPVNDHTLVGCPDDGIHRRIQRAVHEVGHHGRLPHGLPVDVLAGVKAPAGGIALFNHVFQGVHIVVPFKAVGEHQGEFILILKVQLKLN